MRGTTLIHKVCSLCGNVACVIPYSVQECFSEVSINCLAVKPLTKRFSLIRVQQ